MAKFSEWLKGGVELNDTQMFSIMCSLNISSTLELVNMSARKRNCNALVWFRFESFCNFVGKSRMPRFQLQIVPRCNRCYFRAFWGIGLALHAFQFEGKAITRFIYSIILQTETFNGKLGVVWIPIISSIVLALKGSFEYEDYVSWTTKAGWVWMNTVNWSMFDCV